jgi:hypothetical protein
MFDVYRPGRVIRTAPEPYSTVDLESVSLVTLRNLDTGRCVGFFRDVESVLKVVAKLGLENWVAEQRHPTLAEIEDVFKAEREAAFQDQDVWHNVRRRDP